MAYWPIGKNAICAALASTHAESELSPSAKWHRQIQIYFEWDTCMKKITEQRNEHYFIPH